MCFFNLMSKHVSHKEIQRLCKSLLVMHCFLNCNGPWYALTSQRSANESVYMQCPYVEVESERCVSVS